MDFRKIRSHTFGGEDIIIEADLGLPDPAFGTAEDDSMLTHHLHELPQASVILLGGSAIDTYIIMDPDDAREAVCHLVNVHLKNVLRHLEIECHVQEPIPSMMDVKGSEA